MEKKKVFVVDDSPFIKEEIKEILKDSAFEVVGYAKDGESALEKYAEINPDVVTMDIIMPGMDGMDTAKLMLEKWPDAKIIIMSSLAYEETIAQGEEIGIHSFVFKPIEPETLMESLKQVTGQQ